MAPSLPHQLAPILQLQSTLISLWELSWETVKFLICCWGDSFPGHDVTSQTPLLEARLCVTRAGQETLSLSRRCELRMWQAAMADCTAVWKDSAMPLCLKSREYHPPSRNVPSSPPSSCPSFKQRTRCPFHTKLSGCELWWLGNMSHSVTSSMEVTASHRGEGALGEDTTLPRIQPDPPWEPFMQ